MSGEPRDKANSDALRRALQSGDFSSARELMASHGAGAREQKKKKENPPPRKVQAETVTLADACGTDETALDGCSVTVVRRAVEEFLPQELAVQRECVGVLRGARHRFDELEASAGLCHAADAAAEDILFVTGETASASDPVFYLVGVMFLEGGKLMFEQYFARDERQEKGVLKGLASRYGAAAVVATFSTSGGRGKAGGKANKSIVKALLARCDLHGVDLLSDAWEAPQRQTGVEGPVHLDLRKECRDRWGRRGRSMASIERALLRPPRDVRLPRGQMADAYRQFLATGDAADVGDILLHNALDMVTMASVLCQFLTGCEPSEEDA